VFFMLASGNLFKRKIVMLSASALAQRKLTVEMLDEIDNQIRRYLLVLVASNLLVGTGTWLVFHYAGLEYAGLWGFVRGGAAHDSLLRLGARRGGAASSSRSCNSTTGARHFSSRVPR
jgi:hypothetical protein